MILPKRHLDLTGRLCGYVTPIKPIGFTTQHRLVWLCKCRCGNTCKRQAPELTKKDVVVSCGCKSFEKRGGKRDYKSYQVWRSMIARTRDKTFPNYGARGIKMCKRWQKFENFLADMGDRPSSSLSIDRIDNDGDYKPGNCRWATSQQQTRNSSRNLNLTFRYKTQCVADWAKELGIPAKRIYCRLDQGWSIVAALTHPVSIHHPRRGKLIPRNRPFPTVKQSQPES